MIRGLLCIAGALAFAPFWLGACGKSESLEAADAAASGAAGSSDALPDMAGPQTEESSDAPVVGDGATRSDDAADAVGGHDASDEGDGATIDSASANGCAETVLSSLPGVTLQFPPQPATFTLARAAQGIAFEYDIVVDSDVPGVVPEAQGSCGPPDSSGLIVHEVISGNAQNYCVCDQGRCVRLPGQSTISVGTYRRTMAWAGKNWNGPSDTGNPMGAAFPAGNYALTVDAKGTVNGQPFEVRSQFCFALRDAQGSVGVGCGDAACSSSQVCVQPACCPSCTPALDAGSCPPRTAMGRCPIGGFITCIGACTAPAPHCADPPALCAADPPCNCLTASECGASGGSCTTLGARLECNGCF